MMVGLIIAWLYYVALFYLYRVKHQFESILLPLVVSILIFSSFFWFADGGLSSSVPYAYQLGMLASILIVPPHLRWKVATAFLVVQSVLIATEVYSEGAWVVNATESAKKAKPVICMLTSMTMAYLAYHLKAKFDAERRLLRQQSYDLEEKNAIIDQQNESIRLNNYTLEQKVVERTQRLEQINQQLTDYAFYNSHKVRGPLCRIMGLAALMRDRGSCDPDMLDKLLCSSNELDEAVKYINVILEDKMCEEGLRD